VGARCDGHRGRLQFSYAQFRIQKLLHLKKLISVCLLICAFPFFAGGGFEISGKMGAANLPWAILLSLTAHGLAYSAGIIASPKTGKIGSVRSAVFVFFLIQPISFLVNLFALIYGRVRHVELLEPGQLDWGLVVGASALVLMIVSARSWKLLVKT
jgi:hypothetical protein